MSKLTKKERIEKRINRRRENVAKLNKVKHGVAEFCGIGGKYSALELVIISSVKLGLRRS